MFYDQIEKWFKIIKKKHPDTGEKLKYKLVTSYGTCCWKFRSLVIGGNKFSICRPGYYKERWGIKKVILEPNCAIDYENDEQCEGRTCAKINLLKIY